MAGEGLEADRRHRLRPVVRAGRGGGRGRDDGRRGGHRGGHRGEVDGRRIHGDLYHDGAPVVAWLVVVLDASTATQGLFGGSGVTEVPWDPLKCSRDVVELLLKRLPEAAHVKAVMLYVHGPMDSTPLRRHAATHIQSSTWRMNMPYALEWEKDAMKHLLVAEFEHRKRMALDEIVPVTYLDGEQPQCPVDIAEAYTREKRRRPPRNILQWYGA